MGAVIAAALAEGESAIAAWIRMRFRDERDTLKKDPDIPREDGS